MKGKNKKLGTKRNRNPENWKRNIVKHLRNHGLPYISKSGNDVPEKIFEPVVVCCSTIRCFSIISVEEQENCFNEFWMHGG